MKLVRVGTSRWYVRVEQDARGTEYLYLTDPERPSDSMRRRLPFSWRDLDEGEFVDLARDPDLRLWTDEHGIQWRIAPVGPGTRHSFPLRERYLIFDSASTWAGVTPFPDDQLGELTDEKLRGLRNSIADLGGGRRSFRPPDGPVPRARPRPR